MRLGQKHTSSVSEAILKEQRQLRMERLLASPGLIIGLVGFLVILLTAVLIPLFSSVDPNAMVVSERLKPPSGEHFLVRMNWAETFLPVLCMEQGYPCGWEAVWLFFPVSWELSSVYMPVTLKYWIRF